MLSAVSFWNLPVPDHVRIEFIKKASSSFQNKDGPFSVVSRQDAKAKGNVRQLSEEWFFKMMPNGEKILRSWMVHSLVSEKLYIYCFCWLFTDFFLLILKKPNLSLGFMSDGTSAINYIFMKYQKNTHVVLKNKKHWQQGSGCKKQLMPRILL